MNSHTDDHLHPGEHPSGILPRLWHGMTIFQINAETRQELGMAATDTNDKPRSHVSLHTAKKMGQAAKNQAKRQYRRADAAKTKGEVSEKHLSQAEKELFYQAKVKELKSFFECGVWEFSTSDEAVPERTLSSRILLKWSKNSDGSPRAKARLVVRGYNDVDALSGNLETASPTTSRLARSMLLCVSANLCWEGWSADVSTAFLQGLPQERKLWLQLPKEALEILGAPSNTRMFLKKPVYGQLDAPRRWYLEAVRRLCSLGWVQHALDPCLFMLYDENTPDPDLPDHSALVGMLCLHVDDMLGAGDSANARYQEAESKLKEIFNFRTWEKDEQTLEYCGVKLHRKDFAWELEQEEFIKKVKPITLHKGRSPEDEMNDQDRSQLRGLLGSLQWPSVQSAPFLQCSTSLISGRQKTGKLRAIIEANQLLNFAKKHADVRLQYVPLNVKTLADLRLCVTFDAAHGVREDATSQGGFLAFITTDEVFSKETPYHVIDWRSFKLPCVARSSLSAEAQACGQASDMAEYICRFWSCMRYPPKKLRDCMDEKSTLVPTLITDAKALFDSYHKEGVAGASSVDRRTSLEIRVSKEQLQSLGGRLKWVSSERQFADGLTKSTTRTLLAERLRHRQVKFVWDPEYKSAKKKSAAVREASRTEFSKMKDESTPPNINHTTSNHQLTSIHEENEQEAFECEPTPEDEEIPEYDLEQTPVEAYAGNSVNVKALVYVMVFLTQFEAVSADDVTYDEVYATDPLCFNAILALCFKILILYLAYHFGTWIQHRRHFQVVADTVHELELAYSDELARCREQRDDARAELSDLQHRYDACSSERDELAEGCWNSEIETERLKAELNESKESCVQLRQHIVHVHSELDQLMTAYDDLSTDLRLHRGVISGARRELDEHFFDTLETLQLL